MNTAILGYVGSGVLLMFALTRFLRSQDDMREPPVARTSIPVIGHIIGMLRYKVFYYRQLRQVVGFSQ